VSTIGPSGARLLTNVVGFDDGPFERARARARVLLVGALGAPSPTGEREEGEHMHEQSVARGAAGATSTASGAVQAMAKRTGVMAGPLAFYGMTVIARATLGSLRL
jgi:hypothetical protein